MRERVDDERGASLRYRFVTNLGAHRRRAARIDSRAGRSVPHYGGRAARVGRHARRRRLADCVPVAERCVGPGPDRLSAMVDRRRHAVELAGIDLDRRAGDDLDRPDRRRLPARPGRDPGSTVNLPEVWDFSNLQTGILDYRVFNTTRSDNAWSNCLETCAVRDLGPNPPDGTWQAILKIDNWAPDGSLFTEDIFTLNDNDTGANPSIDVPFVSQDVLNTSDRTAICFDDSAGGAWRFLRFFQFFGPDPANSFLGVGDAWSSGDWTSCSNTNGLRAHAGLGLRQRVLPRLSRLLCASAGPRPAVSGSAARAGRQRARPGGGDRGGRLRPRRAGQLRPGAVDASGYGSSGRCRPVRNVQRLHPAAAIVRLLLGSGELRPAGAGLGAERRHGHVASGRLVAIRQHHRRRGLHLGTLPALPDGSPGLHVRHPRQLGAARRRLESERHGLQRHPARHDGRTVHPGLRLRRGVGQRQRSRGAGRLGHQSQPHAAARARAATSPRRPEASRPRR